MAKLSKTFPHFKTKRALIRNRIKKSKYFWDYVAISYRYCYIPTLGKDLKVGDIIRVWWSQKNVYASWYAPNLDKITKLVPYKGPLSYLWEETAYLADFEVNKVGMTIEPDMIHYVKIIR